MKNTKGSLEVKERRAENPVSTTPVLFIHGAWHGAWCWDYHFLSHFKDHGYHSYALSLRGHGGSPGEKVLRWSSIDDYVKDVKSVVDTLDNEPILIGHSMGGYIIQKYLEKYPAKGAVLLASVPPKGTSRVVGRFARHEPMTFLKCIFTLNLRHTVSAIERTRKFFFSPHLEKEKVEEYHGKLGGEAFRIMLDILFLNRIKTKKINCPLLILGGGKDIIIPPGDVEKTAKIYGGAEKDILPGIAHDIMLEPEWQKAADRIIKWIKEFLN